MRLLNEYLQHKPEKGHFHACVRTGANLLKTFLAYKQPRRAIINLISTRRVRNLRVPALIEFGLSAVYNVVLSLYFCLLSAISIIPIRLIEDTIFFFKYNAIKENRG